jgi:hypothetical protein
MLLSLLDVARTGSPSDVLVIVAVVVIVIAIVSVVAVATGIFVFVRLRRSRAGAVREAWASRFGSGPEPRGVPIDLPNKLT